MELTEWKDGNDMPTEGGFYVVQVGDSSHIEIAQLRHDFDDEPYWFILRTLSYGTVRKWLPCRTELPWATRTHTEQLPTTTNANA